MIGGAVLLVCTRSGVDMQQDRSTGWRLGTNRRIQFRYQVLGIVMGAVLCVVLARIFMSAYPVLALNSFDHPDGEGRAVAVGDDLQVRRRDPRPRASSDAPAGRARGRLRARPRHRDAPEGPARQPEVPAHSSRGRAQVPPSAGSTDAVLLPSPYAYAFGTFVELPTAMWWGAGGILSSAWNTLARRRGPRTGRRRMSSRRTCPPPGWSVAASSQARRCSTSRSRSSALARR